MYVISVLENGAERYLLAESFNLTNGLIIAVVNGNEMKSELHDVKEIVAVGEPNRSLLSRQDLERTLQILRMLEGSAEPAVTYH
jgi:hypothetical protein